jgi:hypothetical protein
MYMNEKPQEISQEDKPSEDYPMGGSLEHYDIWRDLEMLEMARHRLVQRK